jgi:hypothetical protein
MLRLVHRLRFARLLATAAILLMIAAALPHSHAVAAIGADPMVTVFDDGCGGDHDEALPDGGHCTVCHLAQGAPPDSGRAAEPNVGPARRSPLMHTLGADLAAPGPPARPPRRPRIA